MKVFFKKILIYLLTLEAKMVIHRYRPHIVAITGSVGKTSTKDAIYAVVSHTGYVRKSEKSYNSEVGLPLTILGAPNAWSNPLRWVQNLLDGLLLAFSRSRYPGWLVLEVGADRPGDIKNVSSWLPVDIAVLTRLPEVLAHVEFFESADAVVEEKASLIDALKPDGTLVLYGDDERVAMMRARAAGKKIITFGLTGACDVRAEDMKIVLAQDKNNFPIGMTATLITGENKMPIEVIGTVGAHALYPLLAAAGVGQALGKNEQDIAAALRAYEPPLGRMHIIVGIKDTLIIDDTYNSSPAAAEAALETLFSIGSAANLPAGRRVAVLGDMLELGRHSVEEHRKLGARSAKAADIVITVGFRARDIAEGALDNGLSDSAVFQYEDAKKAGEELAAMLREGDIVLIKGSQSMRMERTVLEIMSQPERAPELLVRQDKEWIKR